MKHDYDTNIRGRNISIQFSTEVASLVVNYMLNNILKTNIFFSFFKLKIGSQTSLFSYNISNRIKLLVEDLDVISFS